jgi:hypothetical protein
MLLEKKWVKNAYLYRFIYSWLLIQAFHGYGNPLPSSSPPVFTPKSQSRCQDVMLVLSLVFSKESSSKVLDDQRSWHYQPVMAPRAYTATLAWKFGDVLFPD